MVETLNINPGQKVPVLDAAILRALRVASYGKRWHIESQLNREHMIKLWRTLLVLFTVLWTSLPAGAKAISCADQLEARPEFAKLSQVIALFQPRLVELVNQDLTGTFAHFETPDCALRGSVCGRASRLLRGHLEKTGFQVRQVQTSKLDRGRGYVTSDHTFLVVTADGQDVIVDPAYLSFFKVIDREYRATVAAQFGEILVLPYASLDVWIADLVGLRRSHFSNISDEERQARQKRYNFGLFMNDATFALYLKRIWDLGSEIYLPKSPAPIEAFPQ